MIFRPSISNSLSNLNWLIITFVFRLTTQSKSWAYKTMFFGICFIFYLLLTLILTFASSLVLPLVFSTSFRPKTEFPSVTVHKLYVALLVEAARLRMLPKRDEIWLIIFKDIGVSPLIGKKQTNPSLTSQYILHINTRTLLLLLKILKYFLHSLAGIPSTRKPIRHQTQTFFKHKYWFDAASSAALISLKLVFSKLFDLSLPSYLFNL